MTLTSEILSRIQFGFTIGFHILFPTLNLGLALFLTIMEAMWLKTRDPFYLQICKFWVKVFALTFGMGVVSGVVLSYELGTNFGRFTDAIGAILGVLFTYEVLSAFFLEAGFLGIMLFGWNRVSPKLHFAATCLVMIGTVISAFWIMSANSWMQTPAGFVVEQGKYFASNWLQAIFNPSFIPRFLHMLVASYVTTAYVIMGVAAWYILRNSHLKFAKMCFQFAVIAALIITPVQILLGDIVGLVIHEHQPLKTAAMEGVWETGPSQPFLIFAIPDQKQQKNLFAFGIPYLASWINTHHLEGELIGLKSVAPADQPKVATVFYAFRIMLGIGFFLFFLAIYAAWLLWRKNLYSKRWLLHLCVWIAPLGFVATISGWLTTEMGRQPWVVYHLMRTEEGVSLVPWNHVLLSLSLFIVIYGIVFSFYLYYLFKIIRNGPSPSHPDEHQHAFTYMT